MTATVPLRNTTEAHAQPPLVSRVMEPTFASLTPSGTDIEVPRMGSRMLGLVLKPQGEQVARLLEAREGEGVMFPEVVIQMPRRSTKTTAIWSTIIGRAATRENYRCVVTAQKGTIASSILLEHANLMIAAGTAVESGEKNQDHAVGKVVVYRSGGREALHFPTTHSRIWVVPPDASAVRSAAADDVVIDEAGEHDLAKGQEFLDGVQPLMDTRGPLAQLIITGTPGKVRAGFFWNTLEAGRTGTDPVLGILDYSIRDDEDIADRQVWWRVHPGPSSGLTPMSTLERRWAKLGEVAFAREYLCRWPMDGTVGAIDMAAWRAAKVETPPRPERFGIAFDVAPDGSAACLAVAWRDEAGLAHLGIQEYRSGTAWLAKAAHSLATRSRLPVAYDNIGANRAPAVELERMGRVRLVPGTMKDAQGAVAITMEALRNGTLRHFGQESLDAAAQGASFRDGEGGRLWARKASANDITPLVAAGLALWQADTLNRERGVRTIRSTRSA